MLGIETTGDGNDTEEAGSAVDRICSTKPPIYGETSMPRPTTSYLFVLLCAGATLLAHPTVHAVEPVQSGRGNITGHVWLDNNCDGIKDIGEANVPNMGIVQLVNTGTDRVLNPGDHAQTLYTDAQGNWLATGVRVSDFDGIPSLWAVAVGKGSAALLGYKPSIPGGDNILRGPEFGYASETFQLQEGVTLQLGEIGVCPLPRLYLPVVQK
jgi:hypothetical protein